MTLVSMPHNAEASAQTTALDPEKVAGQIEVAGMGGLAVVLLHTFKPLAWIGGQVAWMLQPFVDGLGAGRRSPLSISGLANLLESEHGVDDLLDRLTRNEEREMKNKEQGTRNK